MKKPHLKQFKLYYTDSLPVDEINSYTADNGLKVIAMFPIFGHVRQQSIVVSFEPYIYEPTRDKSNYDK